MKTPKHPQAPRWADRLLELYCAPHLLEEIQGDLQECFQQQVRLRGLRSARIQYVWAVLSFLRPFAVRRPKNPYSTTTYSPIMLHNYFKIAWRNLLRNKTFSAINIFGIAIGFAACLLIGTYIAEELSYDRYHTNQARIVRLVTHQKNADFENGIAKVAGPWGLEAKRSITQVEEVTRFVGSNIMLWANGEQRYYEQAGLFVDASVFSVFTWPLLSGDPQTALQKPNTLVLSKTMAEKYFGQNNALGQVLKLNNTENYTITGVMQDIPGNSHFTCDYLISMASLQTEEQYDWVAFNQFYTYLLLRKAEDKARVEQQLKPMLLKNMKQEAAAVFTPFLQPLSSIHLHSQLFRELAPNSDSSYLYIFGVIGLFILLIASINFINLSTASASRRSKEVGIRKATGAAKSSLMTQFLGESLLTSTLAAVLAILVSILALRFVNRLFDWDLAIDFVQNPWLALLLLGMLLFVGILSGSYPALIMAALKPARVLKGNFSLKGNSWLRGGLVVFQFSIAVLLTIASFVAKNQLAYIQNKNLGFNKEQILNLSFPVELQIPETTARIKTALQEVIGVKSVSLSANYPGGSDFGVPAVAKGFTPENMPPMRCLVVDEDFLDTYEIELAAGRGFSKAFPSDRSAYLVNETAAKVLGWESPLEEAMAMPVVERPEGKIIGVVKDFHFRSLHEQISPLYLFMEPTWFSGLSIKLNTQDLPRTLGALEQKWKDVVPDFPFDYSFFDTYFDALHQAEQRTSQIVAWFTGIAILVSCMGLFGIATFVAEQRKKEIGIRKVLGASVQSIALKFSGEFIKLVLFSILIASPIAYYLMQRWLQDFQYRIKLEWWIFAGAATLALTVAFLTVLYQALRTSLVNPVNTLKSE
jgi:putative ABC transport system permease protein